MISDYIQIEGHNAFRLYLLYNIIHSVSVQNTKITLRPIKEVLSLMHEAKPIPREKIEALARSLHKILMADGVHEHTEKMVVLVLRRVLDCVSGDDLYKELGAWVVFYDL